MAKKFSPPPRADGIIIRARRFGRRIELPDVLRDLQVGLLAIGQILRRT
jgi:hypothetical protein